MEDVLKKRLKRLREALPEGYEAALIQTTANRFYFLDFDAGDAGTLLVLPDKLVYFIDSRYKESAEKKVRHAEVVLQKDLYKQLAECCKANGVRKMLLEKQITLDIFEKNKEKLPDICIDASGLLSQAITALRQVKDVEEIDRIRNAQAITDACFEYILPYITPGAREVDVMLEMERFMRANGAQQVAFDTIFLAGANTSLPHGNPSEAIIQRGDFVTLDFGAKYRGYCSDMTRTVAVGKPSTEKQEIYDLVLQAHLAGIAVARAGRLCCKVDAAAREMIQQAGYGEQFGHGLGHSVGIEIHEEPRFTPRDNTLLASGMLMTVEPGVYLAGAFGCRIEDTVLIGEQGCTPLPISPKELLVL